MGDERGNGVDGAIGLLLALGAAGGTARVAAMQAATGLPRASLFRIARTLAAEGLLELSRGEMRMGAACRALLRAHAARMRAEDAARMQRMPALPRPVLGPDGTTPIALSRPALRRVTRRVRIGFANASLDNPWRVALMHSVEHAAAALGERVERLDIRSAAQNGPRQAEDIAALAAAGMDGLLVSAVQAPEVSEAVADAQRRGLPVVLVDRGVRADVPHTSFVTTSDRLIGSVTALWLAETLKGEGRVLMLPGHEGAAPARERLASAREVFARFAGITPVDGGWTGWQREEGRRLAGEAIATWGRDIAGVWSDSGLQGIGALQAFVAAGYRAGEIPPHTGGDVNGAYKLAIRNKVPLAAVDYPPAMGMWAVEVLHAALSGRWVPRHVEVPLEVTITRGRATRSVRPNVWAEDHVRWDLPDDLILSTGLGPAYNPRSFRIHYPGNRYNRSAGRLMEEKL